MKRSYQILVTMLALSCALPAAAACPCARQKKAMRPKGAASETSVVTPLPVTESVGAMPSVPQTETMQVTKEIVMESKPIETIVVPTSAATMPAPAAQLAPVAGDNKIDLAKQSDFDAHITKHPHVVAVFSAIWCGPCKKLKPVLDEIRAENKDIMFVYVDGDEYPGLVSKYASVGFPTLKLFKNGKVVGQAIGGQSKEEIQSLINQHLKGGVPTFVMQEESTVVEQAPAPMPAPEPAPAPVAQEKTAANKVVLSRAADFEAQLKNKNVIGVFTTTWCGPCKQLKPVLEELIGQNSNVTFVFVDGDQFPGLVSKYASVGFPTLKFFKNGKEVDQTIGGRSKEELQNMIQRHFRS